VSSPIGQHRDRIIVVAILLLGFALRVTYVAVDRFHADEALYASWALRVWDGDPWLTGVPVDKPPLFLYLLAASAAMFGPGEVALRFPNLAASCVGIALLYRLGRCLYGHPVGLWSATFVALLPYDILFARTAFTDPLLVLWITSATFAAAGQHWFAAGALAGLAFATKQHAILLIPLVVAVGLVSRLAGGVPDRRASTRDCPYLQRKVRTPLAAGLAGASGFLLPWALVTAWDSARWSIRPGYWQQSALSYGGLGWAPPREWGERLSDWLVWARYLVPSPLLATLLITGSITLLVRAALGRSHRTRGWLDIVLAGFAVAYVAVHTVLDFGIWDRYLLPLVAPLSLLLARIVVHAPGWARAFLQDLTGSRKPVRSRSRSIQKVWFAAVVLAALVPGLRASMNGYPVGGEHWAYQGLDQVVAYLRANAPSDAVLYHHWLRWHYEYYMYGSDLELRWWQSAEHLRREVARTPERAQYIVLPDWRTLEPDAEGIVLRPVFQAHRQDGSVSLSVYRVELDES